jgi:hypothetical protein
VRALEIFDSMKLFQVTSWWYILCAVATFNVIAWAVSAAALKQRQSAMSADSYIACRRQLLLSAIYVFGCAFRSALPVYDVPRLCLFNEWFSSVVVGRSVATVAELSFVAQWALMLRQSAAATGLVTAKVVPRAIVPLIAVAELCSWYSVLTTSNAGHVIEETLWGISGSLVVLDMVLMCARCTGARRRILATGCIAGAAYVAFMFLHDVPMYWSRWMTDEERGRHYLSIAQGLLDVSHHRVVSYRWEDWKTEIGWMSLYFSVAVWVSISLIHASLREAKRAKPVRAARGGTRRVTGGSVTQ